MGKKPNGGKSSQTGKSQMYINVNNVNTIARTKSYYMS